MPNPINIGKLISKLEHLHATRPRGFDMEKWIENHECGTVACLGGWAELIMIQESGWNGYSAEEVGEWLGLSLHQYDTLFFPMAHHSHAYTNHIPSAIKLLNHLIATGEVNWAIAKQESS